jgi:hypothetical protein
MPGSHADGIQRGTTSGETVLLCRGWGVFHTAASDSLRLCDSGLYGHLTVATA